MSMKKKKKKKKKTKKQKKKESPAGTVPCLVYQSYSRPLSSLN
jgi:hypothetical protein